MFQMLLVQIPLLHPSRQHLPGCLVIQYTSCFDLCTETVGGKHLVTLQRHPSEVELCGCNSTAHRGERT